MSDRSKTAKRFDTHGVTYEQYEDRGDYTIVRYGDYFGRFNILGEWDYSNDLSLYEFQDLVLRQFGHDEAAL